MRSPEFTLQHLLLNSVDRNPPGRTAIVDGDRAYSYEELWRQSSLLARALQSYGLRRGDRVGIYLEKCWEAVVAILGVSQAGGVFVNINPLLKASQVHHIVRNCDIKVLVGETHKLREMALPDIRIAFHVGEGDGPMPGYKESVPLSQVLSDTGQGLTTTPATETDLATIIYTSGSTGLPKGIMVSQHNLVAGAQIVSSYLGNTSKDRVLSVLPFSFDYGLNQLTTMVRVAGTLVLQRSLLPGNILRSLREAAITGLAGVPPVWILLLQVRRSLEREPLTSLRYITNSGGSIPSVHLEQLRTLLPHTKIYLMYGLTEAFRSTYLPPEEIGRGATCIGRAIPNTDIWVVNSEGEECAAGEVGELIHRGPTVALGYWGDKEKTHAAYRPNPFAPPELRDTDPVVYSGDLVWRDEDGFLHYVGRRDELIKTEGYRVSPQEVEELLYRIPAIQEAAVFGVPDPLAGQRVMAVVAMKHGAQCTSSEIRQLCSEMAPRYLVPRIVHILPELPKTATGKIDRSRLKDEHTSLVPDRTPGWSLGHHRGFRTHGGEQFGDPDGQPADHALLRLQR